MSIKKGIRVFLSAVIITTGLFAFTATHTTNAEMKMAGIRLQT